MRQLNLMSEIMRYFKKNVWYNVIGDENWINWKN